ncbi:hypothetical protein EBI_26624, partial [Enterocytozoon bieneusi H348]
EAICCSNQKCTYKMTHVGHRCFEDGESKVVPILGYVVLCCKTHHNTHEIVK